MEIQESFEDYSSLETYESLEKSAGKTYYQPDPLAENSHKLNQVLEQFKIPATCRHLGEEFRTRRIQKGWNQDKLAELSGISRKTISWTELMGSTIPQLHDQLLKVFEVDVKPLSYDLCNLAHLISSIPEVRGHRIIRSKTQADVMRHLAANPFKKKYLTDIGAFEFISEQVKSAHVRHALDTGETVKEIRSKIPVSFQTMESIRINSKVFYRKPKNRWIPPRFKEYQKVLKFYNLDIDSTKEYLINLIDNLDDIQRHNLKYLLFLAETIR